jgi:glycosyltransferase involved in cell wall biosynthesis
MVNKKLSVIITAYDKHPITVIHTRESLVADMTPDEVIVINDGGDPGLLEMLKVLPHKCPLIYARINENIPWNYPGAVNLGTWLSRGDYLAFEDNDNIPNRTFYTNASKMLDEMPNIGRVIATKRHRIYEPTALNKPSSEWTQEKYSIGPNQGTSMIRRDIILRLKGQDERLSGQYGYMYMDWRARMLSKTKTEFGMADFYWYVMDVQSDLPRNNSCANLRIKRINGNDPHFHSSHGILNFIYEYQVL